MTENIQEGFLKELFSLEGKLAVVVGGTGVLCGEMAGAFWRAGARVVLVGRDGKKAEDHFKRWGSKEESARFLQADATIRSEVEKIPPTVCDWFGEIDIWVNGAGLSSPTPYLEISDEEFHNLIQINVTSIHLGCQTIGRHWIERKQRGSIINISSMAALRPLSRNFTYSMSKAALLNLTQNLAREWAPHGIRVNALCPGFFPTEQNRKMLDQSRVESILSHTPMGRFGDPDDLLGAALLLASEKAGRFMTGTNLVVDGGFSVVAI